MRPEKSHSFLITPVGHPPSTPGLFSRWGLMIVQPFTETPLPSMKICNRFILLVLTAFLSVALVRAEAAPARTAVELFAEAVQKLAAVIEPAADAPAQTLRARLELTRSEGLPKEFKNQGATLAFQAPDRLSLSATIKDRKLALGRDGQELWMYVAEKHWGIVGKPGEPRFLSAPEKKDKTKLGALKQIGRAHV